MEIFRASLLNCDVNHVKNWFAYRRKLLKTNQKLKNKVQKSDESAYSGGSAKFNPPNHIPSNNILLPNQFSEEMNPFQNNNSFFAQNFIIPHYRIPQQNISSWITVPIIIPQNFFIIL